MRQSHNGFIYSLLIVKINSVEDDVLITGSGDGYIKFWNIGFEIPKLIKSLHVTDGCVLSLFFFDGLLYIGESTNYNVNYSK